VRDWWSHLPEHINPYIIEIGSFRLGYYGLMYLVAFAILYLLVMWRLKHEKVEFSKETVQDFLVWAVLGLIIGARLGYVLLYNFAYYASHPLEIILPFEFSDGLRYTGIAGMSYHGGVLGVFLAGVLYCRRRKLKFWRFADFFAPAIPLGYTFGRIGNFINGELFGRATTVPWGMYFPQDPEGLLRHPSQLYEAFFEGVVLFAVLWSIRKKRYFDGFFISLYLIGYGLVRFFIEFFREPDPQLGLVSGPFTQGQVLCFIMVAAGGALMLVRARKGR
jgi:phosphatidylglycerol:prolipoprotein diacylglycerol transferase